MIQPDKNDPSTPVFGVPSPVQTREQDIPLAQLTWKNFERLCYRLIRLDQNFEHVQFYGIPGDEQEGIDIYARHKGSNLYTTYQCKNEADYGPAKIIAAVDRFLEGQWASKSSVFVLCSREPLDSQRRADEVERQSVKLRAQNVTFIIWDKTALSSKLKDHPEIVEDFFGRAWVGALCGDEEAERLGKRVSEERLEIARTQYCLQLANELASVTYRGLSGVGHNGSEVTLLLDEVYVPPHFLSETNRSEITTREKEILDQLRDPDLDDSLKAQLESEYSFILISQWKRSSQVGWADRWAATPHVTQPFNVDRFLTVSDLVSEFPKCVVLGAPGSGKSTLLRWAALCCVQGGQHFAEHFNLPQTTDDVETQPPLAILVSLAAYASQLAETPNVTIKEFIIEDLENRQVEYLVDAYLQSYARNQCWFLLDGVDEITDSNDRATVIQRIETFLAGCADNRCTVTSRPHGYHRLSGHISHIYLDHFTLDHAAIFTIQWHIALERQLHADEPDFAGALEEAESLCEQIGQSENLKTLATNPLMLLAMILIHRQKKALPDRRVELYNMLTDSLLDTWNHWRSAARYDAGGISLNPHQLRRVLGKIAVWAHREKPTGILPKGEIKNQIVRALEELDFGIDDLDSTAQSYLNVVVERAGLLEERVPGVFSFWHPTFEEFLAADELTTPASKTAERLVPFRLDPRWREVTLLAVSCIAVLHDDVETASDIVTTLAYFDVDVTEPLIHRHLRLAIDCVKENPHLQRNNVQRLLLDLTHILTRQPYEPMGGDFRDVVNALRNLRPNAELIEALEQLINVDHSRGDVRAAAYMLLANAAHSNEHAKKLCKAKLNADIDAEYKDALARFYAAIGIARAGEIDSTVTILVWANMTIGNLANVVDLLGIGIDSKGVSEEQKEDRLNKLRLLLSPQLDVLNAPPRSRKEINLEDYQASDAFLSRLGAALILLFAGDTDDAVYATFIECLKSKYDGIGAIFDAAHAPLIFDYPNQERTVELQRLSLAAFRRWFSHPTPARRLHSAREVLHFIEVWDRLYERSVRRDPTCGENTEAGRNDNFFHTYRIGRTILRQESFSCLKSCLHVPDFQTRLIAADTLLDREQETVVVKAIVKWMKTKKNDFPRLAAMQLVERISQTSNGLHNIISWLQGDNDWLQILASGALSSYPDYREEVAAVQRKCLSSEYDEIRSSVGGLLAFYCFLRKEHPSSDVVAALRSCLGSAEDDASRNAAAALYRCGIRDEQVLYCLNEYLFSQQVEERFATIDAFHNSDMEQNHIQQLLEGLQKQTPETEAVCRDVIEGHSLTTDSVMELSKLINRQADEDHECYFIRRCLFDWLWWKLEMKSQLSRNSKQYKEPLQS